jgi:hypothetical protein
MFKLLANKVITGVISFSMMLLSSYKGNEPDFSILQASVFSDYIVLETHLQNAFENDFEEIFRSGNKIDVFFRIKATQKNEDIVDMHYKHSIQFDTMKQVFTATIEETGLTHKTSSYPELLRIISKFQINLKTSDSSQLKIDIASYLKKMNLKIMGKEYDMMMLWNFKKPKIKEIIEPGIYEIRS